MATGRHQGGIDIVVELHWKWVPNSCGLAFEVADVLCDHPVVDGYFASNSLASSLFTHGDILRFLVDDSSSSVVEAIGVPLSFKNLRSWGALL